MRRIDTARELSSYDTVKQELPPKESVWQKRAASNPDFDPAWQYPASFMELDLGKEQPQWQYFTREELIRKDQEGHQSLREQYGSDPKKSPGEK